MIEVRGSALGHTEDMEVWHAAEPPSLRERQRGPRSINSSSLNEVQTEPSGRTETLNQQGFLKLGSRSAGSPAKTSGDVLFMASWRSEQRHCAHESATAIVGLRAWTSEAQRVELRASEKDSGGGRKGG